MIHRKQRLYLGVEHNVIISNYFINKDDSDNESKHEAPLQLDDKQAPS